VVGAICVSTGLRSPCAVARRSIRARTSVRLERRPGWLWPGVAGTAAAEDLAYRVCWDTERATDPDVGYLARMHHAIDRHLGNPEQRGDFSDGEQLGAACQSWVLRVGSVVAREPLLAEIHISEVACVTAAVTSGRPVCEWFTGKSNQCSTFEENITKRSR